MFLISSTISLDSDDVEVTFTQDDVSQTVKMSKAEYIQYVKGLENE